MTWKEIWETTKCNESHEFDIQVWHPVLLQNYTEIIYLNSTKQNISQFHNLRKNYFQFKKKKKKIVITEWDPSIFIQINTDYSNSICLH
jgi:hypothetical protein